MSALLQGRDVTVDIAGRTLLREISLDVSSGELWAVLGPNGAGKSTLLRTILGLQRPSRGLLTVGGTPLHALSHRERAQKLAWVPQTFDGSLGFTGLELVLMGRAPRLGALTLPSEADEVSAWTLLESLGLSALARRRTDALSGGELRMLLLARALMQSPEFLLLDEPTAFLDLRNQLETLTAVRRRVKAGVAAIAVLHDVNHAVEFADHVLLLRDGAVLAAGPTAEVLTTDRLTALYGVTMQRVSSPSGTPIFIPDTAAALRSTARSVEATTVS